MTPTDRLTLKQRYVTFTDTEWRLVKEAAAERGVHASALVREAALGIAAEDDGTDPVRRAFRVAFKNDNYHSLDEQQFSDAIRLAARRKSGLTPNEVLALGLEVRGPDYSGRAKEVARWYARGRNLLDCRRWNSWEADEPLSL